tara:strand:+ start:5599 stop:6039 length:441 start_codon:yes stop_codon:yes gene_type:complete
MVHPYSIGLDYGWADDALNEEGHNLLNRLANLLKIEVSRRENLEMEHMETMPAISQGIGAGVSALRSYIQDLESWFPDEGEQHARGLGRSALDVGLTRSGWKEAYAWMESVGLGRAFAEGAWMEKEEALDCDLPEFFNHPKKILGL